MDTGAALMKTYFVLIKNNKIENVIVADSAMAEKIKTEQGYDDILERTDGKNYGKNYVWDDLTSDFVDPQVIADREAE
jgi:hypothetical protein